MNVITVCGRATTDIELKTTQTGKEVASFSLAVERDFSPEGKVTDFIPITAWGKTAEFASKYFSKGRMMIVGGSLRQKSFVDKDGNKRTTYEIVANNIWFAGDKATREVEFEEVDDVDLPF